MIAVRLHRILPILRVVVVGVLVLGVACKRAAPASGPPTGPDAPVSSGEPQPPSRSSSAVPAFVLYTVDVTVVVPTDGSARLRGEGLWVQDDRHVPARVSQTLILDYDRAERMGVPECTCGEGEEESVLYQLILQGPVSTTKSLNILSFSVW